MSAERNSVLHSWCVQSQWDAPTVVGGAGARLHLEDGRSILDMSSLAECSNLGHQHPRVVAAIREQAERLCFVTNAWGAAPRAELAEPPARAGADSTAAGCSSRSAVPMPTSTRSRSRDRPPGKPRGVVITRDRSYHGATLPGDGALRRHPHPHAGRSRRARASATSRRRMPIAARSAAATTPSAANGPPRAVADRIDQLRRRSSRRRDHGAERRHQRHRRAGHLLAGAAPPHRGTRRSALIADEVMSGFGRCGEWFAWQRHGEAGRPDLMTLAKGLTGAAVPLGAVVLSSADRCARSRTRCSTPASPTAAIRWPARPASQRSPPTMRSA